jgi:hypothetical protein
MKRTIAFLAVIAMCQTLAFGQKKYEMVVETTDGNSVTFPTEFIKRIYFRESNVSYKECPDDNHPHLIDLGLPSGTLWACCNIGASKPEDYGNYYAWGETQPKEVYNWDTYQYGYYNGNSDYSHLVNIGSDIAGTQYDAATANWGAPWCMPSREQRDELYNCTSVWTTENGVDGLKFTGPNGGTLFLPAAGGRGDDRWDTPGSTGYYWSSTLLESFPNGAWNLHFNSGGVWQNTHYRSHGESVRPVRKN